MKQMSFEVCFAAYEKAGGVAGKATAAGFWNAAVELAYHIASSEFGEDDVAAAIKELRASQA